MLVNYLGKEVVNVGLYTILSRHLINPDYPISAVRSPEDKPGKGKPVDLRPAAGWFTLLKEQLGLEARDEKK